MRRAIILAAAMTIAACHSRNEDQAGAAPDTDRDAPATHAIDTTRTGPPGTGGRPSDATVTMDSVTSDSAAVVDTTSTMTPSPTSTPQDTLGPSDFESGTGATTDSAATDTSGYR